MFEEIKKERGVRRQRTKGGGKKNALFWMLHGKLKRKPWAPLERRLGEKRRKIRKKTGELGTPLWQVNLAPQICFCAISKPGRLESPSRKAKITDDPGESRGKGASSPASQGG